MKTNRSLRRFAFLLTLVPAILLAGALLAPRSVTAAPASVGNTITLLLHGIYQPITHGPNFGLSVVDLNDGTYAKVSAYALSGIPGTTQDKPIGDFYARLDFSYVPYCAYHLPGGAIGAIFASNNLVFTPDADFNGVTVTGTWELDILEATGVYKGFVGGKIHMVDELHISFLDGTFDERHCYCTFSH